MANDDIRFLLVENGFFLPGATIDKIINLVESFCDLVASLREDSGQFYRWSQLEFELITDDLPIRDLLYGSSLPRETRQRFIQAVNRCLHWDDLEPENLQAFQLGQHEVLGMTLSHAFELSLQQKSSCCLGLRWTTGAGWITVTRISDISTSQLYFLSQQSEVAPFYRIHLLTDRQIEDDFLKMCGLAFPDLHFMPELLQQIRRFEHSFEELYPMLVQHFAALNDHFKAVFLRHQGAPFETAREMMALTKVQMSPESPQTHQNHSAMKKRQVNIQGQIVVCEWHTKLFPTVDRIHFHPGNVQIAEGKIIVGIFTDHLPT